MWFLTRLRSEERSHPAERRRGHGPSRRRATACPRLEMLEERRVLSTLTVTSNSESAFVNVSTLRNEIAAAQPGDTIVFDPGLKGQTITLTSGQLEINKDLTIQGPGAGLLAISGGGYLGSRVFQVDAGATVTISGLTIEDGYGERYNNRWSGSSTGRVTDDYDGLGGGILNFGTLALSGCNVTGNSTGSSFGPGLGLRAAYFEGGGIFNDGTLALSGCNMTGNSAYADRVFSGYGGGISNHGTMSLNGSTVTGNTAGQAGTYFSRGGGIYNDGTMTLSGSTVTGNTASAGGAIFNDTQGNLTILSSVVQNNTASDGADICSLGSIKISKDSQVGKVSHK
jgi:hypothetical protein